MDDWTELNRFPNAAEAQVVAGFLVGEGLKVQLFGVHSNNLLPHVGDSQVRLMVHVTQLKRARELLEAFAGAAID